jgi:putative transposase
VFLEHDTRRRLHIAGVTQHPTQDWTTQQARNPAITDAPQDKLRFLLRDRDTKYSGSFDAVFQAEDINILTSAPAAPRAGSPEELPLQAPTDPHVSLSTHAALVALFTRMC